MLTTMYPCVLCYGSPSSVGGGCGAGGVGVQRVLG